MKQNCIIFLLVLLSFAWAGCGIYYTKHSALKSISINDNAVLTLDSTYKYYIRQLYLEENAGGQKSQNTIYDNTSTGKLLEIEYLFLSRVHNNAIYISTVPDKYQRYYQDTATYKGESFVNIEDFRKIFFGKLRTSSEIDFISKDGVDGDVWKISTAENGSRDIITLETIEKSVNGEFVNLIPVDKALEQPIVFKQVPDWSLIYKKKKDSFIANSLDKSFHIRKTKNKYEVFFDFSNPDPRKKTTIYFSDKRIKYSPEPLFY